jgi:dihydroorotate dehydrogenase (fumarate)
MGLTLKNPLVVSSGGLSGTADSIVEIEKAGAGAVVLKSIFEDQNLKKPCLPGTFC